MPSSLVSSSAPALTLCDQRGPRDDGCVLSAEKQSKGTVLGRTVPPHPHKVPTSESPNPETVSP